MIQEFYTKLTEKEKKILYAALAVVVLASFDLLFLRPVSSKLNSLEQDIAERSNSLKRDVRFLSYRNKILKDEKAYQVYQTDESKNEEEIIASFLKTLELLATESKINLTKVNPAEVLPKKGYIEYFANLECDGRLDDMIKFIHKIDKTDNLLKVVKVDLTGNKASAEGVKASMKISKLIIDAKALGGSTSKEEKAGGKSLNLKVPLTADGEPPKKMVDKMKFVVATTSENLHNPKGGEETDDGSAGKANTNQDAGNAGNSSDAARTKGQSNGEK